MTISFLHIRNMALAVVFVAIAASQALAKPSEVPVAHGKVVHDFARITFEWPQSVYFKANANGKRLTITFDRKANPNFGPLLSALSPYVVSAERKSDGKTVVLTLDKPYRIRTFVSDHINGVDLLGVDVAALRKPAAAAKNDTSKADDRKKTPPAAKPEKQRAGKQPGAERALMPLTVAASEGGADTFARLAPSAGEEGAPADAAAGAPPPQAGQEVPAESGKEPAVPVAAAEEAADPPASGQAQPVQAVAPVAEAPPVVKEKTEPPTGQKPPSAASAHAGDDSNPMPLEEAQKKVRPREGELKVNVSAADDSAILRFPTAERIAMATFVRNHSLWIVFNKVFAVDMSDFSAMPKTVIANAELLKSSKATILRMHVDENMFLYATREEDNLGWVLQITSTKKGLTNPLGVRINTTPPAPAHVFIPTLEMAEPVLVRDPVIGDTLAVVPLFNPGEGTFIMRDFVEFTLLQTVQGIAVVRKSEAVSVVQQRDGLRIGDPRGSVLTTDLPDADLNAANASVGVATLFPYENWKAVDPIRRRFQVQGLLTKAALSEGQDANEARLRLAQLYLSEGMSAEAIGLLDNINRTGPSYYRSAKLAAMRGAANFLMYRFAEAAKDFSAAELNNNKEVDYWRSMLSDLLGNPEQNYDYLAMNDDYISKYPPQFRQRLAIVAADRAVASKSYNMALKIFDGLKDDQIIEPIKNYISFLIAKISSDTGQIREATDVWDKLAADFNDPFVQARAEFSRIAWGMDHNTVNKEQAIDRLERLRLAWHGDSLELNVLSLLGDLYHEKTDLVNAMRIWNGGIQTFTNTATAVDMSRKMQEAFIRMFSDGQADALPTLEALALYYEYRNYMPPGAAGQAMLERLADRLVSVDLLDQAAALFDHQMHAQAEKEYRSRLGTKLATIYLLNHQPKRALAALQDSVYGENSLALRMLRNRLAAQAMVDMEQPDKALETLGQDNSSDAERIRVRIYWQQKDWPKLAAGIEELLKARTDKTAKITLDESEYLLKLALAYVFENDKQQLQYLQDYFGPLMADNPNKQAFDFITNGDMQLTTTNFDELVQRLADARSFIENYKAHMQTAGLDAIMK